MYTGSRPKKISEKQNRSGVLKNLMYGYVRWHVVVAFGLVEAVGVISIQNPFRHRVRHHGEAGEEIMFADGKSGDVVERVGHKLCACRKIRHFQALGVFGGIEWLTAFKGNGFDELGGCGMADDGQIQSGVIL